LHRKRKEAGISNLFKERHTRLKWEIMLLFEVVPKGQVVKIEFCSKIKENKRSRKLKGIANRYKSGL